MRTSIVGMLIFLLAASHGCSGGDRPAAISVTTRDSAGISIVENGPIPAEAPAWTLTGPTLEIGGFGGDPEYELFQVRGAVRLPDGRIVLANGGSKELRWYGPDGVYLRAVGSEGEGPGEFRELFSVTRLADSLLAWDWRQRRASLFDLEGNYARSFAPRSEGFANVSGVFADGSLLLVSGGSFGAEAEPGRARPDAVVSIAGPDGAIVAELGSFPGNEAWVHRGEDFMMVTSFTGGRGFQAAIVADRVVMGPTDRYEYRQYDRAGTIQAIVRLEQPPVALTPADLERERQERLERIDESQRDRWRRIMDELPRVTILPAFRSIRGDAEGNVWVEDRLHPTDESSAWTVFAPDGRALTKVRLHERFRPMELGADYVLGVVRDELDVERLQLWRLEKPADLETSESR